MTGQLLLANRLMPYLNFFFDGGYRAFVFDEEEQLLEVFSSSATADYLFIHHESELLKTMGA